FNLKCKSYVGVVVITACARVNLPHYYPLLDRSLQFPSCSGAPVCTCLFPHVLVRTRVQSFIGPAQHTWERCGLAQALLERGCPRSAIEDPRGSSVFLRDRPVTSHVREPKQRSHQITQLQPQQVLLHLRPGEPQNFEVKFKRVEDYPIDLYYLMDLSFSMEDDLVNVKKLGIDLMDEMRNITEDFRIGFGAFVDKTVMPYISTTEHMLQNPCKRKEPCAKAFGFHHVLGLTRNGSLFEELVGGQRISGNMDLPEGGLDALMQATVCEEQIGWRNVTRLLVFSTDGGFHFAGDGKLGGIVLPNDGKCHLENNVYTMSERQDYPSLAHMAEKLKEKNIQTIFAVTEDVVHLYEGLKEIFPKTAVGTLSSDSHNILQLIVDAYNALTSEVIMDHSELLQGYQVEYNTSCKGHVVQTGEEGRRCSNISIGDEVTFQVSVTAPPCGIAPEPSRLLIRPQGFGEEVEVQLRPLCQCRCQEHRVEDSPQCSGGRGALECGACRCKEGWVGASCECDAGVSAGEGAVALCRRDNSSEVCSGRGDCVCGECVCHRPRRNPEHTYYGKFCQCDNFHCDQYQGRLCGGRGRCDCGVCQCSLGFGGSACECPLSTATCLAPDGLLCSGRGHCVCGACVCVDARFQGPVCEVCLSCPDVCTLHRECVLCGASARDRVEERCRGECGPLNVTLVSEPGRLPQEQRELGSRRCRERDARGCWVHFSHQAERGNISAHIHIALHRGESALLGCSLTMVLYLIPPINNYSFFKLWNKKGGENPFTVATPAVLTVHCG
uniref:Integrin beta n=1 Tax=Scleropages formosus TaxID=113540 RepID=A0A8C9TLK6_SCLFO